MEWELGDRSSVAGDREFDPVDMTGHAFQEFVEDDETPALRSILAAGFKPIGIESLFSR